MKTFLQLLPERWGDPEFSDSFLTLVSDELRRMERLLDVIIEYAGLMGKPPTIGRPTSQPRSMSTSGCSITGPASGKSARIEDPRRSARGYTQ